jgi:threonine dehydrogenase-like Zn-dependent dehydrogenase
MIDVRRLIDRVYPLEGYKEAFEEATSPNALKVLLSPDRLA